MGLPRIFLNARARQPKPAPFGQKGTQCLLCRNSAPPWPGSAKGTVPHLFDTDPAEGSAPPLRRWCLLPGFTGFRPPLGDSSTARLYLFVEVQGNYSTNSAQKSTFEPFFLIFLSGRRFGFAGRNINNSILYNKLFSFYNKNRQISPRRRRGKKKKQIDTGVKIEP